MERLRRYCTNCGTQVSPDDAFCGACGKRLSPTSEGATAHTPDPPHVPPERTTSRSLPAFSHIPAPGRDGLLGALLALGCAALSIFVLYVLLAVRGAFPDASVPATAGLALFTLIHGGGVTLDVPPTPTLLGIGGSLRLGLPLTSFALLPFLAALLGTRFLAQRARTPLLLALVAATTYAVTVAVIASLAGASFDLGGVTIDFAPGPFSNAVRAFVWVGLGALLGVSAASGQLLPERARQVLRGALWAVGTSLAVVLVLGALAAVVRLAVGAPASDGPVAPEVLPRPEFSGSSVSGALAAFGAVFASVPVALGNLWLLAHGVPVGFQRFPDLGQIPLVGQAFSDVPVRAALLGGWPWGWEWRLLLLGPVIGLVVGGMVAARGASPERRWQQGALVAIPYAAVALLTALLAGATAEATLGEAARIEVAFRASLAWLLLLIPAGAALGVAGGFLARLDAIPAPRPNRAFLATVVAAAAVLLASLPALAFGTGASQQPPQLASEGQPFSAPPTPSSPEPVSPPATPPPEQDPVEPDVSDTDSGAHPAFAPLLPTLRQKTSAPIILPSELPAELQNVAVDADRSGDQYGVLFLGEPPNGVEETYVHANDVGTIVSAPEPPYGTSDVFEVTEEEKVELRDGTEATLEYLEPGEGELVNQGPYWQGSFERDGQTYFLTLPLADPSGDIARQVLSSMVEVNDDVASGGGGGPEKDRAAEDGGPAPGYNLIETPDGGLSVEVPQSWGVETGEDSEKEGAGPGSWSYHAGEYLFSSITAAPSLEAWYSGAGASGAYLVASEALARYSDYDLTHSFLNANKGNTCAEVGPYEDYDRGPYSGKLQAWYGCGDDGATVYALAAYPEGRGCVIAVSARVSEDTDREAVEHLVETVEADCSRVTSTPFADPSASASAAASPAASAATPAGSDSGAQGAGCSDPAYAAQNPGECGTTGYNPVPDSGDNYSQGVVVGDDTPDCARPEDVLESGLCAA